MNETIKNLGNSTELNSSSKTKELKETKELTINFTDNELKSIAVNAMGRASEVGTQTMMRTGLAVVDEHLDHDAGTINYPKKGTKGSQNSGFSIGVFQWDFGQKLNAKELIEAYNESKYVKANEKRAIDEKDIDKYKNLLQQNRDRDLNGKNDMEEKAENKLERIDIRWHKDYKSGLNHNLNQFFLTDDGYKFVMSLQERQYNTDLKTELKWALESKAVQDMTKEDAVITLTAVAKVKNQTGGADKIKPFIVDEQDIPTKDEILSKIYKTHGILVEQGVKASLKGAELYNTLSNDKGKLGEIFRELNKENPLDVPNFNQSPKHQLIDTMFRHPEKAMKLIEAVNDEKKNYLISTGVKLLSKEAYSIGVKDNVIFTINKDGKGYRLDDNATEFKEFNNKEDKLINKHDTHGYYLSLSEDIKEFLKADMQVDSLTEDFEHNMALAMQMLDISDEMVKDYTNNPKVTDEMLEEYAKKKEKEEQKALLAKKEDDDDNVVRHTQG